MISLEFRFMARGKICTKIYHTDIESLGEILLIHLLRQKGNGYIKTPTSYVKATLTNTL